MNRKKLSYNNIFFNGPNPKGSDKVSVFNMLNTLYFWLFFYLPQTLKGEKRANFQHSSFREGVKNNENCIQERALVLEAQLDLKNIPKWFYPTPKPLLPVGRVSLFKKVNHSLILQCFHPIGLGQKSTMKQSIFNLFFFILFIAFSSCQKEPVETVFFNFENTPGVFITNEGNFMYGNATLSFYDIEKKRIYNHIFFARNKTPLGDVAQSMEIHNGQAFIVVNNSGKVYVADANTLEFKASITGLNSPRYIHFLSDQKAYISDLYAKAITMINPSTYEKIGKIDVNNNNPDFYQHSTEQMLQYKNLVFTNCWSFDNQLLVIDSNTDQVIDSIEVPAQPNSMVIDKNDKIWVLCDGGYPESPYAHERPALVKIDAQTLEIEKVFRFKLDEIPSGLCINGSQDTIYFINRHVYRMDVAEGQFPEIPFIESDFTGVYGGFYALSIHPNSSQVYLADAIDYQQNGIIYRYHPQGHLLDSFKAGVNPGSFCFKLE